MKYYDEWHVRFEALQKKDVKSEATIFMDLTPPKVDIDLTKNQVQQIPVPLND